MASKVSITIDRARIAARIAAGVAQMIPAVAEQALADCNEYCKYDQGQLRESAETASDLKAGELVWNTPYAAAAYYTGEPSHDGTFMLWCEKAYNDHKKDWQKIAQKQFTEGMDK